MQSALNRILELEANGIEMSRNRHFEVFMEHRNRSALHKWRQVAAIRRSLLKQRDLGKVDLELRSVDVEHFMLTASVGEISARAEWRMHAGEIGLLLRDESLRHWFQTQGIDVPLACERFMSGPSTPS